MTQLSALTLKVFPGSSINGNGDQKEIQMGLLKPQDCTQEMSTRTSIAVSMVR